MKNDGNDSFLIHTAYGTNLMDLAPSRHIWFVAGCNPILMQLQNTSYRLFFHGGWSESKMASIIAFVQCTYLQSEAVIYKIIYMAFHFQQQV